MWPFAKAKHRPGLQLEFDDPGLFQLNSNEAVENKSDAEAYEVDIVAIHGLNGTPDGTWTHKNNTFWLKDLLPQDVRGARIFTYSYPSNVLFSKSNASTEEYAKSLLVELKVKRNGSGQERRPIIFIAHSLGGIVCKEALIIARQDPTFTSILDRTKGIIFFGTPHRGANTSAEIGVFFSNVAQTALSVSGTRLLFGRSRSDQIKRLRANAPDLRRIIEGFRHLHKSIHIVSVYETEEQIPLGRLVVDEASATLGIEGEKTIPRYKCHTEICRYWGPSDPGYTTILHEILDLSRKSLIDSPLEEPEKACAAIFHRYDQTKYIAGLPQRVDGTCEWVLKTIQYKQWSQADQASLFWISGHAGSGKTMLSSYIIKTLWSGQEIDGEKSLICCSFFNDGIETQREAEGIVCNILFQVLSKRPHLARHVKSALEYDSDGAGLVRSFDLLWSVLTAIVSDEKIGPVSIVIDALDECRETSRNRLMDGIARLVDGSNSAASRRIKILITSRPHVAITDFFDRYELERLQLGDEQDEITNDMRLVIGQHMKRIAKRTKAKAASVAQLERFLNEKADQSFLWVKLNIDILDRQLSTATRDYDRILAGVPNTLEETYQHLLDNIERDRTDFAKRLLQIIIASSRPLSLEEINVLISAEEARRGKCHDLAGVEEHYLRPNIEMDINIVLKSLVRISDSKLYLVHISLKEFLCPSLRDQPDKPLFQRDYIELRYANLYMASACMAYLSLDDFGGDMYHETEYYDNEVPLASQHSGQTLEAVSVAGQIAGNIIEEYRCIDDKTLAKVAHQHPLFAYASKWWAKHFAQAQDTPDKKIQDLALVLSDIRPLHQSSNWFRFYAAKWAIMHDDPANFDQLAIAGYFGHFSSIEIILEQTDDIRIESLAHALYWASRMGHTRIVNKLLRTGVHPDSWTVACQTALCGAADMGHLEIVKALAKDSRVDIDHRGFLEGTPLALAAACGHLEVVQFLLSNEHHKSVEVNLGEWAGRTPLHLAVHYSCVSVVRILIEDSRVGVNHLDESGNTPFSTAAGIRNAEVIHLLFERPELDVDSPSETGRTPLAKASSIGNSVVIEQLRRRRRLDNSHSHKDEDGRNAISLAARGGHDAVIKLLLDCKIPGIDEEDKSGRTPIFWALEAPTNSTVNLLLDTGLINVNHQDESGRTALSWAVSHGNDCMLRTFLEGATGIDLLLKDRQGLTPLDWAQKMEDRSEVAEILEGFLMKRS